MKCYRCHKTDTDENMATVTSPATVKGELASLVNRYRICKSCFGGLMDWMTDEKPAKKEKS